MSEKVKIYHVETQEDYDDLMIKLEEQGCRWANHDKPTSNPHYWFDMEDETVVYLHKSGDFLMTRGNLKTAISNNRMKEIIKHKAKGVEQMEKVVVPQFVADWYEGLTSTFLGNKISELGHVSKRMAQWIDSLETDDRYGMEIAQEIIAKMHLFQDYEVEEKKYYWRKKKEYLCNFEKQWDIYLNFDDSDDSVHFSVNKFEGGYIKTKFTEVEVLNLVGEEDFNKLERVEIDDVQ